MAPPATTSVKVISETHNLASIPSTYIFSTADTQGGDEADTAEEDSIPTVDFSLLTTGTPAERSKAVYDLGKACRDWGFFMVINHGVPEEVRKKMMEAFTEFFDQGEEEKRVYETKHVLDPIRYGTSFNQSVENVFFWRDYLKIMVHPQFHSPTEPSGFREISREYCKRVREMARELVRGISESLGLEGCVVEREVNLESCLQILVGNLYPPCPQPHLAMGLPSHSDHCLLTILIQNDVAGLQILHNDKWVKVNPIPNSFLINTADQLEILSNGKYKSVLHRAIVNDKATRMSVGIGIGPSLDTVIAPLQQLVNKESNPPLFKAINYKDYLEVMQNSKLQEKSNLDRFRMTRNDFSPRLLNRNEREKSQNEKS